MARMLGVAPKLSSDSQVLVRPTPHLYQLGAVNFFFDHEELSLAPEQRAMLSSIRETTLLGFATAQRKIDQAEQDLWSLTSVGRPDATRVEAKLTEIASLSTQQRMDYIRAVGRAVAHLTDAQQMLALAPTGLGGASPPPATGSASSAPPLTMGSAAPVGDSSMGAMPVVPMVGSQGTPMEASDAGAQAMGHM
jgi:hypothetical protein